MRPFVDTEKRVPQGLPEVQKDRLELETKTHSFDAMFDEPKPLTIKDRLIQRETRLLEQLEVVRSALQFLKDNPDCENIEREVRRIREATVPEVS